MSQFTKRQRHKQQRQIWRRRVEQDKLAERYEQVPVYPEPEFRGYKPCYTLT